eukprot:6617720-Alexandrium_andersonii.AAC.1
MAHPPDARAPADANSSTAVGIHAEAGREPKVKGNGCDAQTFRGTFTMPANSASPELSAIVFCVVDQCLM